MKQKWLVAGALIVSMLALAGCGKKNKEASIWEISGTYDETSGMLSYENGNYTVHTWDENDNETISEEGVTKGVLMKEGDKLRWSDSKNEEDCLFVKVPE